MDGWLYFCVLVGKLNVVCELIVYLVEVWIYFEIDVLVDILQFFCDFLINVSWLEEIIVEVSDYVFKVENLGCKLEEFVFCYGFLVFRIYRFEYFEMNCVF